VNAFNLVSQTIFPKARTLLLISHVRIRTFLQNIVNAFNLATQTIFPARSERELHS